MHENYHIRPLTHEDYDDVYEVCRHIWGGNDYLPDYFHQWVDDAGGFYGITDPETNRIVGVDKFSILSDGTGWLEGLRVHPSYQGRGLARILTNHVLDVAVRELDSGKVTRLAFSTHITAKESIRLMTSRKFSLKQKYILAMRDYERVAPSLEGVVEEPWNVTFEELQNHPYVLSRDGILPLAFYFQGLTREYFDNLKRKGAFIKLNGHAGIQYFKGTEPHFIVMDETPEGILLFSDWCRVKYAERSKEFPLTPIRGSALSLISDLVEKGFTSWNNWEEDYLYFQYLL